MYLSPKSKEEQHNQAVEYEILQKSISVEIKKKPPQSLFLTSIQESGSTQRTPGKPTSINKRW